MMNANTNTQAQAMINNAQATALTEAVTAMAAQLKELVDIVKAETTEATTTTATTTTDAEATTAETTTTTTAPIIVIDDDDNVIATTGDLPCPPEATEFKGSMIEQEPMDPMPNEETADTAEATQEITDETATAEENADEDTAGEEYLDNILRDISVLYDIAEYALDHEGYNISSDRSPYAPKDNKVGSIDDRYRVFISKEVISSSSETIGTFRLIVNEKTTGIEIMSSEMKIINDHIKVYSSENTVRIDKINESKKLMRFLEITDEVSALVMSKYISD